MRLWAIAALAVPLVLAACGGAASPAKIEATPAVQQTALPSGTRAPSDHDYGY